MSDESASGSDPDLDPDVELEDAEEEEEEEEEVAVEEHGRDDGEDLLDGEWLSWATEVASLSSIKIFAETAWCLWLDFSGHPSWEGKV